MDKGKYDEAVSLKEILESVNKLIVETRAMRKELREAEAELEKTFKSKKVSLLTYDIQKERIR